MDVLIYTPTSTLQNVYHFLNGCPWGEQENGGPANPENPRICCDKSQSNGITHLDAMAKKMAESGKVWE